VEVLNRPTPEGIAIGKELARLTDRAEEANREKFPNAKERCGTCAYRLGTIPNGCAETVMDALKCALEFRTFMCHETMVKGQCTKVCTGWLILCSASRGKVEAPWSYSDDPEEPAAREVQAEEQRVLVSQQKQFGPSQSGGF
jgi:hypothetical protein